MTVGHLQTLIEFHLAMSVAMLLVLCLRKFVRQRLGATAAYLLWLAVPLCAAASLLPSPFTTEAAAPIALLMWHGTTRGAAMAAGGSNLAAALLLLGWMIGVAFTALLFGVRQSRFVRSLGRLSEGGNGVLRGEHLGAGPIVLGVLRPRIVVPADFETRFDEQARTLILAHERVHLARGDALVNGLVALAQCLAWFNPLAHMAGARLRADQEIACDTAVIRRHPRARRAYAEALLDTLLVTRPVPLGCHWPPSAKGALNDRIAMLGLSSVNAPRQVMGLAVAASFALVSAGAVWAAGASPGLVTQPLWLERPTTEDVVRLYPAKARAEHLSGSAMIGCGVARNGRLRDCKVLGEAPLGEGFGEAALQIAPHFQMAARSRDGQSTAGAQVRIPMRFIIP